MRVSFKCQIAYILLFFFVSVLNAQTFNNPIISGSYPDPSICKVGDDYYLSNSSFEYFPGVPIWHSKDLVNWQQIGFGIHRQTQFNFDSIASSAGAWAGTIRYNKGIFYLPLTWVDWRMKVGFKNVILSATNPAGPWSDPYVITDTIWGIDPSLFFDDDGKCYWLMNHPPVGFSHNGAACIMIQEIDLQRMQLIGKPSIIGRGAMIDSKYPEGPKLFKKDDYYYLLIAEGGSGIFHAVTISRSKNINGPYENYEGNPILTHRSMGYTSSIINIGHADMVQTQNGEWWMVCLGSRTLSNQFNLFGRETFLVPVQWNKDEWPVVGPDYGQVRLTEVKPNRPSYLMNKISETDNFDSASLSNVWSFIRTPRDIYSLTNVKGELSLKLRSRSINPNVDIAFIGQRLRYVNSEISASFTFYSKVNEEEAGLMIYKSEKAYLKFVVSEKCKVLKIISQNGDAELELARTALQMSKHFTLKIKQTNERFTFYFLNENNEWVQILADFDGSIFSVEKASGFMGTFIGIYGGAETNSTNVVRFEQFTYRDEK